MRACFSIFLKIEDDSIKEASFTGESCAICKGAASIMVKDLVSIKLSEVENVLGDFDQFVTDWDSSRCESFKAFSVVSKFPTRMKCLKLPWETLRAAISGNQKSVTTE